MWSSAKVLPKLLLLLAILAVAGCGFRPMYGGQKGQAVDARLASIRVVQIDDRSGQEVRNALEHRLFAGGMEPQVYTLDVSLTETIQELGILRNRTASRANLRILASWTLRRGDAVIQQGETEGISAYNILDEQYATVVSRKDARSRAALQLADEIIRQVSVAFSRRQ